MRFNTDSDLSDHEKDSFSKGNNIIITTPKASGQKIKEKRQLLIIKQLAFIVLEAGLEPAQPQWPRDFKSLAQFHHSSILIFSYSVINQVFILSRLYIKRCNKNVWFNSQFNSAKETKMFDNKLIISCSFKAALQI